MPNASVRLTFSRAAGREDHLARMRPDQLRDLHTGVLDHAFEFRPEAVQTGRIAPLGREVRHHGLKHFRGYRGCGVVIEVNHKGVKPGGGGMPFQFVN